MEWFKPQPETKLMGNGKKGRRLLPRIQTELHYVPERNGCQQSGGQSEDSFVSDKFHSWQALTLIGWHFKELFVISGMGCNYRSWRKPTDHIKSWQRPFQAKGRETKSFVHILMQRTGALLGRACALGLSTGKEISGEVVKTQELNPRQSWA